MQESKKQNYLHGAVILTAGVVIMKILGAIYKIPLGNILGDEGYAHFMVAYNIYNVFLTLSTAGLPVALSRMISEADTLGRTMQMRRTFRVAFVTFACIGLLSSLIMFLFPTELASMMNDVEAAQSIWALSPAMFLVCMTSAYRGYAQGQSNMTPTTVSQILDVLAKTLAGLALAWYFTKAGKSLPIASAGAIFGVTAGSVVALVYIAIYKHRHYPERTISNPDVADSPGRILKTLLRIGIPITFGSCVLSLINLIDAKLVLNRLQMAAGFSYYDAKILYGIYGKVQTLYNLPAAFITPLTISIVPAITALIVQKKHAEAGEIAESSLRIAGVIALPMGVGLAVLANPIVNVVYPGSNEAGPALLLLLGIASFFVCMALMTTAILQATGNEVYPVFSMIAGGIVKIIVNWFLVANPDINITGAPLGTLTCYIVMCCMNYAFICKSLKKRPRLGSVLLRPAVSAAVMGAAAWAVYHGAAALLGGTAAIGWKQMAVSMLLAMLVAVVVYVAAIVTTRAVTWEDMKLIPRGEKIAKVLHIR